MREQKPVESQTAEVFATITLGSCLINNLLDEVLCSNPVPRFKQLANSQFTGQISLLCEENESNLSFKCPNVLILKVYDMLKIFG